MNLKEDFNTIYKSYLKSIIIKSLIYSVLISCSVLFVVSFVFWIIAFDKFWISFICFGVSMIASFATLFMINKPNEKRFAVKLDSLGLKQRAITMTEYKNSNSLMARIQRQNAIEHISRIDLKKLKVVLPKIVMVLTIIAATLSIATVTVSGLSSKGYVPDGGSVIDNIIPGAKKQFELNYEAKDGGYIEGEVFQVVYEGENASMVVAKPDLGFAFVRWSDDFNEPVRQDLNVMDNIDVYAIFERADGIPQDEVEDPESGNLNKPKRPQDAQQPPEPDDESASDEYESHDQVFDGETKYAGPAYDNAYSDAIDEMQQDSGLSDGEIDIISDYYHTIAK